MIALGLIFFLQTGVVYSRLVILSFAVMIVVCAFVSRLLRMGVMLLLKRTDIYSKNVLIIGAGRVGEEIRDNLFASKRTAIVSSVFGRFQSGEQPRHRQHRSG
ncbi:hypothetical protein HMSSN036_54370 [Paenibacillus macerans]|nr:hypothetical protein HMSSN036_54370 [Paenibacillus macerans]